MTKARTLADNFAADINGITAGTGITGGGTSGTVTVTNQMATTIDAKGDLIVGTGADAFGRLAVASTAGYLLTVDSAEATGLKWAAAAGGGKVLQVVTASSTSDSSTTSTSFQDTGLTCNITPSSSNSKVLVLLSQIFSADKTPNANMVPSQQLLRGSTSIASSSAGRFFYANAAQVVLVYQVQYTILDTPATTSQLTYKTQHKVNGSDMTSTATGTSTITLLEIGA